MSRIEQAVPYIKTKKTNYRFVVLALIFIVYAINYADRTNIGAVLPFIIDEFHINNFEAGAIASMFFLGYAPFFEFFIFNHSIFTIAYQLNKFIDITIENFKAYFAGGNSFL